MVRSIKRFFKRTWNVLRWMPIHWNEFDWDYYYIWVMEKNKLDHMIQYFQKNGNSTSNEWMIRYMKIAYTLLTRLIEDDFFPHSEDDSIPNIEWEPIEGEMMQAKFVGGDADRFRKANEAEEALRKKHIRLYYLIMEKRIRTWWN